METLILKKNYRIKFIQYFSHKKLKIFIFYKEK
jgi:hypothetical protein